MKNNIRGPECGLPFILFATNDVVFEVSTTDWMLTTTVCTVWISYFNLRIVLIHFWIRVLNNIVF